MMQLYTCVFDLRVWKFSTVPYCSYLNMFKLLESDQFEGISIQEYEDIKMSEDNKDKPTE